MVTNVSGFRYDDYNLKKNQQLNGEDIKSNKTDYTDGLSKAELEQIDTNHDGIISREEFNTALQDNPQAEQIWNDITSYVVNTYSKTESNSIIYEGDNSNASIPSNPKDMFKNCDYTQKTNSKGETVTEYKDENGKYAGKTVEKDGKTFVHLGNKGKDNSVITYDNGNITREVIDRDENGNKIGTRTYNVQPANNDVINKKYETVDGKQVLKEYDEVTTDENGVVTTTSYKLKDGEIVTGKNGDPVITKTCVKKDGITTTTEYKNNKIIETIHSDKGTNLFPLNVNYENYTGQHLDTIGLNNDINFGYSNDLSRQSDTRTIVREYKQESDENGKPIKGNLLKENVTFNNGASLKLDYDYKTVNGEKQLSKVTTKRIDRNGITSSKTVSDLLKNTEKNYLMENGKITKISTTENASNLQEAKTKLANILERDESGNITKQEVTYKEGDDDVTEIQKLKNGKMTRTKLTKINSNSTEIYEYSSTKCTKTVKSDTGTDVYTYKLDKEGEITGEPIKVKHTQNREVSSD